MGQERPALQGRDGGRDVSPDCASSGINDLGGCAIVLSILFTQNQVGHMRKPDTIERQPRKRAATLAQVERSAKCKARGCKSMMRMAMMRSGDTRGFMGGLA